MINDRKSYMSCMISACEQKNILNWEVVRPHAENEFLGLLLMLEWVGKKQKDIHMSTELARIYIDMQKNTMRNRLMSLAGLTLKDAESIIARAVDSIRKDFYEKTEGIDYLNGSSWQQHRTAAHN
jgi:hypothetical protein